MKTPVLTDPVGIKEVAERLGVQRGTVDQWLQRELMPPADCLIGGRPAWSWPTIEKWARDTHRLNGG
jgi:predicted DNA-binding transcriptional regulator AlpA